MNKTECTKKACEIADKVFSEILNNFHFKTEKELANYIAGKARKNKVKLAFPTIVASGKNAAEIHHKPKKSKLKGFTVIDFGFKFGGYCSDMTRTIFIGKPNRNQIQMYEKIKKVQEKAVKRLKPGIKYSWLDIKSRKDLGKKLKKCFKHALGHGVGTKIHQNPRISPKSKHTAKTGDIVTIEPGVYFEKKYGIRIEDTLLVRKKGCEILTKSDKKIIII